jgi:hypothetical protein
MHAQTNHSQLSSLFPLDPLLYCRSSVSYRRSEFVDRSQQAPFAPQPNPKIQIEPSIRFNIAYFEAGYFSVFRACNAANSLAL